MDLQTPNTTDFLCSPSSELDSGVDPLFLALHESLHRPTREDLFSHRGRGGLADSATSLTSYTILLLAPGRSSIHRREVHLVLTTSKYDVPVTICPIGNANERDATHLVEVTSSVNV
jgi:hypothetical protein